jgi:hypothetical protein
LITSLNDLSGLDNFSGLSLTPDLSDLVFFADFTKALFGLSSVFFSTPAISYATFEIFSRPMLRAAFSSSDGENAT